MVIYLHISIVLCTFAEIFIATMPEILLHYIWRERLFDGFLQQTTDGRCVEILNVGSHNLDAGPDFANVRLLIDGQEWVGNIEIHVHASDWYKHHHDRDKAYDSVILHVVRDADCVVKNSRGEVITQCELQYPSGQDYLSGLLHDAQMMDSALSVHECGRRLLAEPGLLTNGWKHSLITHRLRCKAESVKRLLELVQNSPEQAFYISLAHYFGFHTNGLPFEQLAISTPLRFLQKHRNNLFQLTAMLLGQSGLLECSHSADRDQLWREYSFLQKKFDLVPIDAHLWKMARMRPSNFPEVRIRQFAQLLYQSEFLYSKAMDASSIEDLRDLFRLSPVLDDASSQLIPASPIGDASIDILIINVVVPFKFARGNEAEALSLLESMKAEQNNIIRQWQLLGQRVCTAADSQALIHLYLNYCASARCLNCDVAYRIFQITGNR